MSKLPAGLFLACVLTATAMAQPASRVGIAIAARTLQPGELVVVTLDAPVDATGVSVSAFGRSATAFRFGGAWKALVGIDLDQRPGTYTVTASARLGAKTLTGERKLTVVSKRFPTRTLTVAPGFVDPPPSEQRRIADEAALMQKVYASSAPQALWDTAFVRPVADPANSRFGSRSVFNGQPRSPHAGTDFLSPQGRPVEAPNAGRIRIARDMFFNGNTIVIDHGLDVFSILLHLSALAVSEGETVMAGQVIGKVGATGRVTGPHLHWALRVGGARVDPLSAVALLGDRAGRNAR